MKPVPNSFPDSLSPHKWAFFLDVDGTLLGIQDDFDQVRAARCDIEMLMRLSERSTGACALISGRSVAMLDQIFHPLRMPAAGLHGTEFRQGTGDVDHAVDGSQLDAARGVLKQFVSDHPEVRLEDKGRALAVHFRRAPQAGPDVMRVCEAALAAVGSGFELQRGKMVVEIKGAASNKGDALSRFMQSEPFSGRLPLYVGDDDTDEYAFEAARGLGGIGIRVGHSTTTSASYQLEDVSAVHTWLAACLEHIE